MGLPEHRFRADTLLLLIHSMTLSVVRMETGMQNCLFFRDCLGGPMILRKRSKVFLALVVFIMTISFSSCKKPGDAVTNSSIDSANQQWMPIGMAASDDEVFFVRYPEFRLYRLKKGTFLAETYCQDPTCLHVTDKCAALGACNNLEYYNGTLYAADYDYDMLMSKDGRFTRVENIKGGFTHSGGKLYVCELKSNATLVYSEKMEMERVITEEVLGVWRYQIGHYLYGCNGATTNRIDLNEKDAKMETLFEGLGFTDGTYLYQIDFEKNDLYRRDLDGGNPEKLVDGAIAAFNFDKEYFYFRYIVNQDLDGEKCGEVYRMKKDGSGSPELIAVLPQSIQSVYTAPGEEWIYVRTLEAHVQDTLETVYAVRIDGSETREIIYADD